MEQRVTLIDGFGANDYMVGTEVGLPGNVDGFEVAALVRFPDPKLSTIADDEEFLIFGNGELQGPVNGWALSALKIPTGWALRFTTAENAPATYGLAEMTVLDTSSTQKVFYVHGWYQPNEVGQSYVGLYVNGLLNGVMIKADTIYVPADTAPMIGATAVVASDPRIPPRMSVSALAYREGYPALDDHFAKAWERVVRVRDIDDVAYDWDHVWSARWGFSSVTGEADQQWVSQDGDVTFERTGGGSGLSVSAAQPYFMET